MRRNSEVAQRKQVRRMPDTQSLPDNRISKKTTGNSEEWEMRLPIQIEAILFKRIEGEIQCLILKRHPPKSHPEIGKFWQPVTGGLEEGETRREALKREIKEETGIGNIIRIIEDVHYYEPEDLSLVEYLKRHGYACKHLKAYAFGVEVSSDEEVVLDRREHSEFKWCSFQEALKLIRGTGYEHRESLRKLNEIVTR